MWSYLFLVFVSLIVLLAIGFAFWRSYQMSHQTKLTLAASKFWETTDVSAQNVYAPESIRRIINQFEKIGFQRLGEIERYFPESDTSIRNWIMVDEAQTTDVWVLNLPAGPYVRLSTVFADDAWVETTGEHPRNTYPGNMDDPDVSVVIGKSSDAEPLYQEHKERVRTFGVVHGEPRCVASIDDFIQQLNLWGEMYRHRQMQGILLIGKQLSAGLITMAIVVTIQLILAFLGLFGVIQISEVGWLGFSIAAIVMYGALYLIVGRMKRRMKR